MGGSCATFCVINVIVTHMGRSSIPTQMHASLSWPTLLLTDCPMLTCVECEYQGRVNAIIVICYKCGSNEVWTKVVGDPKKVYIRPPYIFYTGWDIVWVNVNGWSALNFYLQETCIDFIFQMTNHQIHQGSLDWGQTAFKFIPPQK